MSNVRRRRKTNFSHMYEFSQLHVASAFSQNPCHSKNRSVSGVCARQPCASFEHSSKRSRLRGSKPDYVCPAPAQSPRRAVAKPAATSSSPTSQANSPRAVRISGAESSSLNAFLAPALRVVFRVTERATRSATRSTPNPSIERTRTGRPLQAIISFWALRRRTCSRGTGTPPHATPSRR